MRIDTWLWYARFCKSRTLAQHLVSDGHVRVNREKVTKSHGSIRPGDVLTFPQGRDIRVVKVVGIGERRGPASEAAALYEDLAPKEVQQTQSKAARRESGAGRPTKAERRALDRFVHHGEAL
ncbi:MAG: RNA-binding S4 domain-containing protein [Rhodospirillales bacterium]|nr:RNA-binding S4 domain-containing protein [Rhodospirillales bacterium]